METNKKLQDLARREMIVKMLADITHDLQITQLEYWDKKAFIKILREELNSIYIELEALDN